MKTLHITVYLGKKSKNVYMEFQSNTMMEHRHVTGQIIIGSLNLFPFQVSDIVIHGHLNHCLSELGRS